MKFLRCRPGVNLLRYAESVTIGTIGVIILPVSRRYERKGIRGGDESF
jgi:hypothetical protein